MITLTIDESTPSLNLLLNDHWAMKTKTRRRWQWLVKAALLNAKFYDKPKMPKARIEIERYGARTIDSDNCRAGMKFMMDGLVRHGVILDDNPAVIGEPVIRQIVHKTLRRTVIRIEALTSQSTFPVSDQITSQQTAGTP